MKAVIENFTNAIVSQYYLIQKYNIQHFVGLSRMLTVYPMYIDVDKEDLTYLLTYHNFLTLS